MKPTVRSEFDTAAASEAERAIVARLDAMGATMARLQASIEALNPARFADVAGRIDLGRIVTRALPDTESGDDTGGERPALPGEEPVAVSLIIATIKLKEMDGQAPAGKPIPIVPGQQIEIKVQLCDPGFSVDGFRITAAHPVGGAGPLVSLQGDAGAAGTSATATTDKMGLATFTVTYQAAGKATVNLTVTGKTLSRSTAIMFDAQP